MSRVWLRSVMHVKRPGRRANRPMAARRLESPHPKILSSGEKWQHSSEQAGDGEKESQRRPSSLLCLLPKPTCTNLDQNHVSPRSCACPRALTSCKPLPLSDPTAALPHQPLAGRERVVAREGFVIDTHTGQARLYYHGLDSHCNRRPPLWRMG